MQQLSSNADSPALARRQQERRRGGGDTWPGDRVPATSDAEMAYQDLDPAMVAVFKQAMLADGHAREQKQFLSAENAQALLQQATCLDAVSRISALISSYSMNNNSLIAALAIGLFLCFIAVNSIGSVRRACTNM
jgi:hypothetical protein